MPRLFKTAVLYLLLLALPVQGYAATAMSGCGPGHHGLPTAQAGVAAPALGEAHAQAADHHRDLGASEASGPFASNDANGDSDPGNAAGSEKSGCSACAGCCMGAAVTASETNFRLAVQSVDLLDAAPFRNIGFLTDGPRRPPRVFPA